MGGSMKKLFAAVRKGDIDTVKTILDKQPDLLYGSAPSTPKRDAGQSLLQVALKSDNLEIADYLIDAGADVHYMEPEDCGNDWRMPVLQDAINAAIMASRWNTNTHGFGLRVFSTKHKADQAYSILMKMLALGADVNAADSYGNTGIWRAYLQASQVLPKMDHATGELSDSCIFTSELKEDLSRIFSLLLKYGADLNYKRPDLNKTIRELETNKLFDELVK